MTQIPRFDFGYCDNRCTITLGYHTTWCKSSDVARLEVISAELLEALEYAVRIYGRFGAVVNEPYHPGEWIDQAHAAIAKAKGEQPCD